MKNILVSFVLFSLVSNAADFDHFKISKFKDTFSTPRSDKIHVRFRSPLESSVLYFSKDGTHTLIVDGGDVGSSPKAVSVRLTMDVPIGNTDALKMIERCEKVGLAARIGVLPRNPNEFFVSFNPSGIENKKLIAMEGFVHLKLAPVDGELKGLAFKCQPFNGN